LEDIAVKITALVQIMDRYGNVKRAEVWHIERG
jgi:hypothetical protein